MDMSIVSIGRVSMHAVIHETSVIRKLALLVKAPMKLGAKTYRVKIFFYHFSIRSTLFFAVHCFVLFFSLDQNSIERVALPTNSQRPEVFCQPEFLAAKVFRPRVNDKS